MKVFLYIFYLLIAVAPSILLLLASSKFKSRVNTQCGGLLLIGSIMILLHLVSDTGSYLVASFGNANDLATFARTNVWISGILKYLGLILIGVGLLLYVRNYETKSSIDQFN